MPPRVERSRLLLALSRVPRKRRFDELRCVLEGDSDAAVRAWQSFRQRVPLVSIDGQSMRLLPLAMARLDTIGYRDPEDGRLRGMVKFLWVRSEKMREMATRAAAILAEQGISTVAIKGLAMAARGTSLLMRPMMDADLVVESERFGGAVCRLVERGFVVQRRETKAVALVECDAHGNRQNIVLDLHREALPIDPCFWVERWSSSYGGEPYRVLDPAGLLIVTILHGLRRDGGEIWRMDIKPLVDALDSAGMDRLIGFGVDRRLSLAIELGLGEHVPLEVATFYNRRAHSHVMEALELWHVATEHRVGEQAARVMRELRGTGERRIELTEVDGRTGRIHFDMRWLNEWQ